MKVDVIKARYNLKTGLKESQAIVATKDVDDNMEQQILDLFLSRLTEQGLFHPTSLKVKEEGGEYCEN